MNGRDPKIKKIFIVVAILVMLILITFFAYRITNPTETSEPVEPKELLTIEHIGGKYDASIEHWEVTLSDNKVYNYYKIVYQRDGEELSGIFPQETRDALGWIISNTTNDSIIFSWWDYGHAIRGYTEREPVVDGPSKSIRDTIADPSEVSHWENDEKIFEIATAFTSEDTNESLQKIKKYDSDYVFITQRDYTSSIWSMFKAVGKEQGNENVTDTLIFKLWYGEQVEGFHLSYIDGNVKIFKIEA